MKIINQLSFIFLFTIFLIVTNISFAQVKYSVSGKTASGVADTALLISKQGINRTELKNNKFSFKKLSLKNIKHSRIYLFKNGQPVGPVALKEDKNAKYLQFSGKAPSGKNTLSLNLLSKNGYFSPKKAIDAAWISKAKVRNSNFAGASIGFLSNSSNSVRANNIAIKDSEENPAADSDLDGVPDILDVDDDNDSITDERDTAGGSVISSMYLDLAGTINAHLGNLSETTINQKFSAENVFSLTLFLGLRDSFSSGNGGHVVCNPSQLICRSSADGGTTSYYTGVSESDNSVRNQQWSNFNTDGSGFPNLEVLRLNGGSEQTLIAAIQPRSSAFSAGEILTANVTQSGTVIGSRIYSILPPVVSVPALFSYDLGSGVQQVDYSNPSTPGSNLGNPLNASTGSVTFNFYPPQRKAITGAEADGEFRDIGNSKIGVLVGGQGITSEFTCAGFYSNLSSGITEINSSESMPGGSFLSQNGAVLWPLVDSAPDIVYSSGQIKSLTVNLSGCISRAGVAPGTYIVSLTYAGTDTRFGAPRSAQNIYITIP